MPATDTSLLIDLMRQDPAALSIYEAYERQGIALATPAITAMELYKGAIHPGTAGIVRKPKESSTCSFCIPSMKWCTRHLA